MEPRIELRLGTQADIRAIAEYMLIAGGGLFEQLLDDIVPGTGAEPLLALALALNQPQSAFDCDNAILAEVDGACRGAVLCFPAADYCLPDAVTAFVPPARLARVETLIRSAPADTFYIHSLAVDQGALRRGLARRLVHAATELAAAQSLEAISLHVWRGNLPAMTLYAGLGFTERMVVPMPPSPRMRWEGPVVVVAAETAALLRRLRTGTAAALS